jgi:hypothetical protein
MSSISQSQTFEISSVALFGRTFDEYLSIFALTPAALTNRRVLDVAAGPSSFTAEAYARGLQAAAVDPAYGYPTDVLAAHIQCDYKRVLTEQRRKAYLFRYQYFPSIEAAEASRRSAAARFLGDYESGFLQDRYIGGALPRLPLANGSFDLVLCAHLLFTYSHLFDFEWHLKAALDLVRVSSGEVRLHPLCGLDGKPYPELSRLRDELDQRGIFSHVIPLDYEFFLGSGTTLVLSRQPDRLQQISSSSQRKLPGRRISSLP